MAGVPVDLIMPILKPFFLDFVRERMADQPVYEGVTEPLADLLATNAVLRTANELARFEGLCVQDADEGDYYSFYGRVQDGLNPCFSYWTEEVEETMGGFATAMFKVGEAVPDLMPHIYWCFNYRNYSDLDPCPSCGHSQHPATFEVASAPSENLCPYCGLPPPMQVEA